MDIGNGYTDTIISPQIYTDKVVPNSTVDSWTSSGPALYNPQPTPAPGNTQAAPSFQFYGSNSGGAHVAIKTAIFPYPCASWCNMCVKLNLGSAQIGDTVLSPGTRQA